MPTTRPYFDSQAIQVGWTIVQGLSTIVLGWFGWNISRQNIEVAKQNSFQNHEIARQNAELAARNLAVTEQKARLEQYERRYEIYQTAWEYCEAASTQGEWNHGKANELRRAAQKAVFLFYPEVSRYLTQHCLLVQDLSRAVIELEHATTDNAKISDSDKAEKAMLAVKYRGEFNETVHKMWNELDELFGLYLSSRPTVPPETAFEILRNPMFGSEVQRSRKFSI